VGDLNFITVNEARHPRNPRNNPLEQIARQVGADCFHHPFYIPLPFWKWIKLRSYFSRWCFDILGGGVVAQGAKTICQGNESKIQMNKDLVEMANWATSTLDIGGH